jgi:hypothetical protein
MLKPLLFFLTLFLLSPTPLFPAGPALLQGPNIEVNQELRQKAFMHLRGTDQKELFQDITTKIIDNYDVQKSPFNLVKAIVTPYLRRDIILRRL